MVEKTKKIHIKQNDFVKKVIKDFGWTEEEALRIMKRIQNIKQ